MTTAGVTKIRGLCDAWRAAAVTPRGVVIGGATEQHRLRLNGVDFALLDFDELEACFVGLTRNLLQSGLSAIRDYDHCLMWAWCAEVMLPRGGRLASASNVLTLFEACARVSLAGVQLPGLSNEERLALSQKRSGTELNTREMESQSSLILSYLAFPLLEAIAKSACASYLGEDGKVLAAFHPPSKKSPYAVGNTCSSLRDVLWLLQNKVASTALRKTLAEFFSHLAAIAPGNDPVGLLYSWRNSTLHSAVGPTAIGGTVFTLAFLIAMEPLRSDYSAVRDEIAERIKWGRGSYYPPA